MAHFSVLPLFVFLFDSELIPPNLNPGRPGSHDQSRAGRIEDVRTLSP
ncbi:hypothetical protein L21SP2_2519 [Salinispira pacifica]|uniref:Uncharacterized protein n=1 Tax=Salinispira pacifica TaxID=1307761 RepID=V5WL03_9SPIO|nr:hypothetical protein L21SP2_2519 [Salinispira pacifica]